jgi:hypothetical protein
MSDDEELPKHVKRLLKAARSMPVVEGPRPADPDNEVWVYATGVLTCSVCAPGGMEREVVERQVNHKNPTGISAKWQISDQTHFRTGETMPCDCPDATGRKHWLLHC